MVDGQFHTETPHLPLNNRGFTSADGLIETMRFEQQRIPLWSLHQQRLIQGLARLNIQLDVKQLEQEKKRFLAHCPYPTARVRLCVIRQAGTRISFSETNQGCCIWQCHPLSDAKPIHTIGIIERALAAPSPLVGLKSINRLEYILAAQMAQKAGWEEAILTTYHAQPIETIHHNLWLYLDGSWVTPDLTECGVHGVARAWLLGHDAKLRIQTLQSKQIQQATSLALTNAVQGVVPVLHFNGKLLDPMPVETLKMSWNNRLKSNESIDFL